MRETICDAFVRLQLDPTSAASPLTCGAAIDVPVHFANAPTMSLWHLAAPGTAVDQMSTPGAATSTHVPCGEVGQRASLESVLATETTFGHAAGHNCLMSPSLPADAT